MKHAILPIGLVILLNALIITINPNIEIAGNIMTGLVGFGIGVALNNLIFKTKKNTERKETEIK